MLQAKIKKFLSHQGYLIFKITHYQKSVAKELNVLKLDFESII